MDFKKVFNLTNYTLLTALVLSSIAAWYSILGLIAIFPGAPIPIIIMGSALEVAKVITTVWLHRHWNRCRLILKSYLVPAVISLAFLTSMGIFGFLSKAHIDQNIVSGDVVAKVAVIDERIKTQRENISVAKQAIEQMNAQVDQRLSRSDSEQAAERAVQIRRQQAGERAKLLKEISDAQKQIAILNDERAPIASELRKVEADVGPIKYIAALIYGDNPDQNVLERSVRWVIILIVFVFDPLALTLVIASNSSRIWMYEDWAKEELSPDQEKKELEEEAKRHALIAESLAKEKADADLEKKMVSVGDDLVVPEVQIMPPDPIDPVSAGDDLVVPEVQIMPPDPIDPVSAGDNLVVPEVQITASSLIKVDQDNKVLSDMITDGVTKERPYKELGGDYVSFEGKAVHMNALREMKPEFFMLTADDAATQKNSSNFGTSFPKYANKGDTFVRVDVLPNKLFRFDGTRWLVVVKQDGSAIAYLHDQEYIKYLISAIESGKYNVEMLSDNEKTKIEEYLKQQSEK